MTPPCSSTAEEERTFASQCASTIAKLSALQRLRGRRALAVTLPSFNETIAMPAKGEHTTYRTMRGALPAYHPCSRASIGECYRSFVAGMRAA